LISDAAATADFKSTRQFLEVWKAAGYRTVRPSSRKHVVLVADVAKFLSERIERSPNQWKPMSETSSTPEATKCEGCRENFRFVDMPIPDGGLGKELNAIYEWHGVRDIEVHNRRGDMKAGTAFADAC